MPYNTGNPVPSTDARDFMDNVQNTDVAVNTQELTWTDRLGVSRKTFAGMEKDFTDFLAASGFEPEVLEYVDGSPLTVLRPTQLIERASTPGVLYAIKLPSAFPSSLSGVWADDEEKLVIRADDSLRQELAGENGAAMIGHGVVSADSIAELLLLPVDHRREDLSYLVKGYAANGDGGGGAFYWDASRSAENDGESVFDGFVRVSRARTDAEAGGSIPATVVSGDVEILEQGTRSLSESVVVQAGVTLRGAGSPDTFNDNTKGVVLSAPSTLDVGVMLGNAPANTNDRNRGIRVEGVKVVGEGAETSTIGFSTYSSTETQHSVIFSSLRQCVARLLGVGFRYRNNWSMDFRQNVATSCGIGHLIDGTIGGTSTDFNGLLAYSCDVGFRVSVTGYN